MALPPIDPGGELEGDDEPADDSEAPEADSDVDPLFAADLDGQFDDKQTAALFRAISNLMSSQTPPGSTGAPAAPY